MITEIPDVITAPGTQIRLCGVTSHITDGSGSVSGLTMAYVLRVGIFSKHALYCNPKVYLVHTREQKKTNKAMSKILQS